MNSKQATELILRHRGRDKCGLKRHRYRRACRSLAKPARVLTILPLSSAPRNNPPGLAPARATAARMFPLLFSPGLARPRFKAARVRGELQLSRGLLALSPANGVLYYPPRDVSVSSGFIGDHRKTDLNESRPLLTMSDASRNSNYARGITLFAIF